MASTRIGVFGGTFNPVHVGHLIIAEQCREQAGLEQVWFIPAARPPHKPGEDLAPFAQRVEMLHLALAGNPAFRVDELEKERSGPSYTVDTLADLRARHPGDEFFFIMGSDSLADFPQWREPGRIAELATLLIWQRPGSTVADAEQLRKELGLPEGARLRSRTARGPHIDIASRDLRRRAAEGLSLRYLVPRAVQAYIEGHEVYKKRPDGG